MCELISNYHSLIGFYFLLNMTQSQTQFIINTKIIRSDNRLDWRSFNQGDVLVPSQGSETFSCF